MQTRILDLDGGLVSQERLVRRCRPEIIPLQNWGPHVRLACWPGAFCRFQRDLQAHTGSAGDPQPRLTFVGSGDFHHVSFALLRRLHTPCNLLVLDNHPDWMRGVPLLHCGTWLHHAAGLPHVHRIFHLGGEVDFDNSYRWLAPWPLLRSGRLVVAPAVRQFDGQRWQRINHQPLRPRPDQVVSRERIEEWLRPFRAELASRPLYISLDKDVMTAEDAAVNWDSGHLTWTEIETVLRAFLTAARGGLAGMDVVGDWSPVRLSGLLRRALHWSEHPPLEIDPQEANERNEAMNLRLVEMVAEVRQRPLLAA
jgi:hypothetical protein